MAPTKKKNNPKKDPPSGPSVTTRSRDSALAGGDEDGETTPHDDQSSLTHITGDDPIPTTGSTAEQNRATDDDHEVHGSDDETERLRTTGQPGETSDRNPVGEELAGIWADADALLNSFENNIGAVERVANQAVAYSHRSTREAHTALQRSQQLRTEVGLSVTHLRDRILRYRKMHGINTPLPEPSDHGQGISVPSEGYRGEPSPFRDEDYVDPPPRGSPVDPRDGGQGSLSPHNGPQSQARRGDDSASGRRADPQRRARSDEPSQLWEDPPVDRETPPHMLQSRHGPQGRGAAPPAEPPDGDDSDEDSGHRRDSRHGRDGIGLPNHYRSGGPGDRDRGNRHRGPPDPGDSSSDDDVGEPRGGRRGHRPHDEDRRRTRSPSYLPNASGRNPYYPATPSWSDNMGDNFKREALRNIRRLIKSRLNARLAENPILKNLKNIPPPDKYSGEDDYEIFESWLKTLLRWMRLYRLGGDNLDEERLQILGQFLKGKAATWYNDTIDNSIAWNWTFVDGVCALFERFLHHATARSAADKFHDVKFDRDDGVSGLWDTLVRYAGRMPQYPDDYTFARKFTETLPSEIAVPLFRSKDVTIEGTPLRALRGAALQQEHNNKVVNTYHARHPARPTATHVNVASSRPGPSRAPYQSRPAGPPAVRFTTPPVSRPLVQGPPQRNPQLPHQTNSSGPRTGDRPTQNHTDVQCYRCGEFGHISRNCPNPAQPGLHAARVIEGGGDTEDNSPEAEGCPLDVPSDPESPVADPATSRPHVEGSPAIDTPSEYVTLEGSQYDVDEEVVPYYAEDYYDAEDAVYYGAMRVVTDVDDITELIAPSTRSSPSIRQPSGGDSPSWTSTRTVLGLEIDAAIASIAAGLPEDDVVGSMDHNPARLLLSGMLAARHRACTAAPRSRTPSMSSDAPPGDDGSLSDPDDLPMLIDVPGLHDDTASQPDSGASLDLWVTGLPHCPPDVVAGVHNLIGRNTVLESRCRLLHAALADARQGINTMHSELRWARRELLQTLVDQRQMYTDHYDVVRRHAHAFNERRDGVCARFENQADIMARLVDPVEWDGIDDPSSLSVSAALQQVLSPPLPQPPPAYASALSDLDTAAPSSVPTAALRAMAVAPVAVSGLGLATRATVRRHAAGRRPDLPRLAQTCLTAYVSVNGLRALVLFDSGSTTDSVSPDFARIAGLSIVELENPALLQLGCVGSRSRINFGATVSMTLGDAAHDVYLDVVNLDRYDVVLGTPFMRRFGAVLNFGAGALHVNGVLVRALDPEEEEHGANRRIRRTPRRVTTTAAGTSGGTTTQT
ncbi:hypothetical protein B0H21DRAFT_884497 [Amylocystis lapponica]|nr:hypothetical protein B0H21DRAFT_884497 [Amylocystis lapponica]